MRVESNEAVRAVAMVPSFEAATGPKVDKWLVKTVGALIAVVGGVLVSAAVRGKVTADAAVEAGVVAAWAACAVVPEP